MSARFKVDYAFTITARGLVLAGQILEGTVSVGDAVVLPGEGGGRRVRVTGVEMGDGHSPDGAPRSFVGLVLGELPPTEIATVRHALSPGQALSVEPPRDT
jgi:translation elongation factor EF-Tu-like GTPase